MIAERTKALLNAAAVIYAGEGGRNLGYEECVAAAYALLARIEAREKATYPGRETVDDQA